MSRKATFDVRARDRALARDLKRIERKVGRFGTKVRTSIGGAFKGGLATIGSFAAVGGIANQVSAGLKYQTTLQRLGDQAKYTGQEIVGLDKDVRGHATTWGLTNEEMLGATAQLVNLQGATALTSDNMAFLGEAMTATGASAANTSRVMSALMDQGVKTPEAMRGAFDALIEAGDAGNIPFDLMANNLSSILPMVKGLVSAGKQGHAEVGGLLQVLGKVTGGDISQAQTLTKALTNQLRQKQGGLRKKGYGDLFDKKGNLRTLYEIRGRLADLGKDKRLIKLITSSEARTAIKAIGDYGDVWEDVTAAAAASNATQRKAFGFMQSSAGKWRKAMADIQNKFQEAMTPERIEKVADAAKTLADVLAFAADNIGLLIGAWAAWKGLGLVGHIADVSASMSELAVKSGKASSVMGVLKTPGALGLVGAVAGASVAIGTYVDQVTRPVRQAGWRRARRYPQQSTEGPRSSKRAPRPTRHVPGGCAERRDIGERRNQSGWWPSGCGARRSPRIERATLLAVNSGFSKNSVARIRAPFDSTRIRQSSENMRREARQFIVPAQNKLVDTENAGARDKLRKLIDSGAAREALTDAGLRDNKDGAITAGMVMQYLADSGIDAKRKDFIRTGDAESDARLAKNRADTERKLDTQLVAMLIKAIRGREYPGQGQRVARQPIRWPRNCPIPRPTTGA